MRYGVCCFAASMLLCSGGLEAKDLCGVKVLGGYDKKVKLSISDKDDLFILSRSDLGEKMPIQYSLKAGRLEREGRPVEELAAELGSTIYVAESIVRGCVIKAEERHGRIVLYLEELFHTPKQEPRIETQIIELE
jgi:hypothetical protein